MIPKLHTSLHSDREPSSTSAPTSATGTLTSMAPAMPTDVARVPGAVFDEVDDRFLARCRTDRDDLAARLAAAEDELNLLRDAYRAARSAWQRARAQAAAGRPSAGRFGRATPGAALVTKAEAAVDAAAAAYSERKLALSALLKTASQGLEEAFDRRRSERHAELIAYLESWAASRSGGIVLDVWLDELQRHPAPAVTHLQHVGSGAPSVHLTNDTLDLAEEVPR